MAIEFARKLYAHYTATDQKERAADILAKYPQGLVEEVKEEKPKAKEKK